MARMIRLISGVVLIFLGLAGALLPILPGWLFFILGVLVLSVDIPLLKKLTCWIENRFPRVGKVVSQARCLLGHAEC